MKYSIITINYNNKEGLRKTIESVVNQTCQDFEYIVIDGGSTDGSIDIIRKYADRIDYWVSEPDKGIYNAMNKGILQAHGEYLNFMNSGDCFYDVYVLEAIIPYLDSDIVSGKNYVEGNGIQGYFKDDITLIDFFQGTLPHQASFIKHDLFVESLYDEKLKIIADWKFFVEALIFKNCTFHNLDILVCLFNPDGISSNSDELRSQEGLIVFHELFPERILKDYIRLSKVESPLLELIPQFNNTRGFHRLVYNVVLLLLKIRKVFLIFRK